MNPYASSSAQEFRRSSVVRWRRFLPWSLAVLLTAALLAGALHLLFINGWYIVMIVPLIAGLILAGMVHLAVHSSHCRSRLCGAGIGILAGTVLYLGQYQIDMIQRMGPQFAARVDLLPRYIALRKSQERRHKVGVQPNAAAAPKKTDVFGNWLSFALEFGFIVFATAYSGYATAGKPYCDRCEKWKRREAAFFPPGIGPDIVRAIEEDRLAALLALPVLPPPKKGAYTAVIAAWCPPPPGEVAECPACVSVKAVRRGGGPSTFSQIDAVFGRTLLEQRPLSSEQAAVLSARFPAMAQLARATEQLTEKMMQEGLARSYGAVAEVRPIAGMDAAKILSKRAIWMGNLLSLLPLLSIAAGALLIALGGFWLRGQDSLAWVACIIAGGIALAAGVLVLGRDPGLLSQIYLIARTRRVIAVRPDAWVDPRDPEAAFMQVVPRERWGKLMLETAADVGFAKIDERRRELLFEGDRERYRIPGEAVLGCHVEKIVYGPQGEIETCAFLCVVRARGPQGMLEFPLGQRAGLMHKTAAVRRQWAEDFCRRVLALSPAEAMQA